MARHFVFSTALLVSVWAGRATANAVSSKTHPSTSRSTSTSVFFATPPASLHVPADFTVQATFETDFLKAFYPGFGPTQTTVEPQPLITDPVSGHVFPIKLTNPKTIPTANAEDPVILPPSLLDDHPKVISPSPRQNFSTPGSRALRSAALAEIREILNSTVFNTSCTQCIASLLVAKNLAINVPWEVPQLLIALCNEAKFSAFGSCEAEFSASSDGQIATQVLASADVTGSDGQWLCAKSVIPLGRTCPTPAPLELDMTSWFAKMKPRNTSAPKPSGHSVKVLHLSDFHLDPRYSVGSEANCSDFLCCRPGSTNGDLPPGHLSLPAPRFGAYDCDTPWLLANAVLHAIPPLTGTGSGKFPARGSGPEFTIFSGDLTAHDDDNQIAREYVEYAQSAIFAGMKAHLGGGPVYAAMGNHDTFPQAFDTPHSIQPEGLSGEFNWNYEHLAKLWEAEGWISKNVAKVSQKTYSAYSTITPGGLKIITINTDFWYTGNWFNYINTTNPDNSGMLRFLTDELQKAEDAGQRVWALGHVLSGWDGGSALPNQANLFYQIVDRFSPHVIANIFMGHIHDEVRYIHYANNGTIMNSSTAVATTWVGPSVTPLTGLNSGFSMYEVDSKTFDIMEAYTWFSNVSDYSELDHQNKVGAAYHFEYSTREEYGEGIKWNEKDPLNATWWHLVTENFEKNPSLIDKWTKNQGRQSSRTLNCTSTECREAKVCYMRSGSPPIAARCPRGFGSVQN